MSKRPLRGPRSYGFVIKGKSLDSIRRKAEFLNQNWRRIREKFVLPELINPFLYRNEYAPLIGTICDERVRSEDAWAFPEWLNSKLGEISPEKIIKLGKKKMRGLLEEYFKDNMA